MDTAVYVADTVGELGLFYRAAPFAFMGGSLVPHGGQNPLEAARLGRAVMAGPHTKNFAQAYETIFAAQGSGRVHTSRDVCAFAARLLENGQEALRTGAAAEAAARNLGGALEKTRLAVEAMLSDARA
jgi:3-deoxy-D-manno-octulosonic-acid transferase